MNEKFQDHLNQPWLFAFLSLLKSLINFLIKYKGSDCHGACGGEGHCPSYCGEEGYCCKSGSTSGQCKYAIVSGRNYACTGLLRVNHKGNILLVDKIVRVENDK